MATIKHVFPGGNTSKGFYSYYNFLPPRDPNRIFVLKGGPGVGKSTFMKKVGDALLAEGYDIEHHHCSSDNNSLDGVTAPELGVALVDGTAPHIVDPKYPGAVDELVDLGTFWNRASMEANKPYIIRSTHEVSRLFARAYKYLEAAKLIADDIAAKYTSCMEFDGVTALLHELINELLTGPHFYKNGFRRHLFGSAYTPNGHIHYTDSLVGGLDRVYHVTGSAGTGKTTFLKQIADLASSYGYDVTYYHTPLIPDKLETIIIHGLGVGMTTQRIEGFSYHKVINLEDHLDMNRFGAIKYELDESLYNHINLLETAMKNIRMAKAEHDSLEKYYVPNMDFEAQQPKLVEVVSRILEYKN
ncbi:ATPase [Vallitalea okinawensis]|uniref:ATPase n=1 Tax=Vallitalea okinawensis TaxID=2078660 RepID=UPI000CFDB1EB|nr:ATPase [Vallitalea okinawensis]